MKTLTVVSPVTNTLAAVVSKLKVFIIQSAKDSLKRISDQSTRQNRDSSVSVQSRKVSSEVRVPEQYSDSYS
jgi:hypothetical protein